MNVPRPARFDLVFAGAFVAGVALELTVSRSAHGALPVDLAFYLPAAAALAYRRIYPVSTLVAMFTLAGIGSHFGTGVTDLVCALLFLVFPTYAVGHESEGRRAVAGIVAGVALMVGATALAIGDVKGDHILFPAGIMVASWTCGRLLRNRMLLTRALADEAARLELDRELRAQAAVGEERARIAREMHDVVAHTMAIMVVQAGAARRTLDRDRAAAVQALATVEETGRTALTELRRLLGFLREEAPADLAPQPSLADLDGLVERARAAGLPVEMGSEGVEFDLGAGGELLVYRVVQEALTNCLKHAGRGASATVTLRWLGDRLEIAVLDSGGHGSDVGGAGHGLVGMRERLAMVGGSVTAQPRPDGGFAVRASIPRAKVAA